MKLKLKSLYQLEKQKLLHSVSEYYIETTTMAVIKLELVGKEIEVEESLCEPTHYTYTDDEGYHFILHSNLFDI